MSRSKRKPYSPIVNGRCTMNWWKKLANGVVRRRPLDEDIANGTHYKMYLDTWTSPKDGKAIYCPGDVKNYRK